MADNESSSLVRTLESGEFSDIILQVGPDREPIKAHQIILGSRSTFFKAACTREFREKLEKLIKLPHISPETMRIILKWMYYGGYIIPGQNLRPGGKQNKDKEDTPLVVDKESRADYQRDLIISTYNAASYLGIPLLQKDIMNAIEEDLLTVVVSKKTNRILDPGRLMEDLNDVEEADSRCNLDTVAKNIGKKLTAANLRKLMAEASEDSFWAKVAFHYLSK